MGIGFAPNPDEYTTASIQIHQAAANCCEQPSVFGASYQNAAQVWHDNLANGLFDFGGKHGEWKWKVKAVWKVKHNLLNLGTEKCATPPSSPYPFRASTSWAQLVKHGSSISDVYLRFIVIHLVIATHSHSSYRKLVLNVSPLSGRWSRFCFKGYERNPFHRNSSADGTAIHLNEPFWLIES